jgi:hypothetical protein
MEWYGSTQQKKTSSMKCIQSAPKPSIHLRQLPALQLIDATVLYDLLDLSPIAPIGAKGFNELSPADSTAGQPTKLSPGGFVWQYTKILLQYLKYGFLKA